MPRVARPAPSDRAPPPFESLIEDTSPPPEAAPPPQDSKVAKSDDKQALTKSKNCKAADPDDDTKPGNTDEVITTDGMPADESAAKATVKLTKWMRRTSSRLISRPPRLTMLSRS
jgi:hypothetical protein